MLRPPWISFASCILPATNDYARAWSRPQRMRVHVTPSHLAQGWFSSPHSSAHLPNFTGTGRHPYPSAFRFITTAIWRPRLLLAIALRIYI